MFLPGGATSPHQTFCCRGLFVMALDTSILALMERPCLRLSTRPGPLAAEQKLSLPVREPEPFSCSGGRCLPSTVQS